MKIPVINSSKSWIWISYLLKSMQWDFGNLFYFQVRGSPALLNIPLWKFILSISQAWRPNGCQKALHDYFVHFWFSFLFQALFLSAIALLTSASISSPLLFLTELEVKIILAENTARTSRNWRWKLSIQMLTNTLPKKFKPLKLSNLFWQKTIS